MNILEKLENKIDEGVIGVSDTQLANISKKAKAAFWKVIVKELKGKKGDQQPSAEFDNACIKVIKEWLSWNPL